MQTFKRYLLSSVVTFLSSFALVFIPGVANIDFTKAALFSLFLVALRAGFKALGETLTAMTADPTQ